MEGNHQDPMPRLQIQWMTPQDEINLLYHEQDPLYTFSRQHICAILYHWNVTLPTLPAANLRIVLVWSPCQNARSLSIALSPNQSALDCLMLVSPIQSLIFRQVWRSSVQAEVGWDIIFLALSLRSFFLAISKSNSWKRSWAYSPNNQPVRRDCRPPPVLVSFRCPTSNLTFEVAFVAAFINHSSKLGCLQPSATHHPSMPLSSNSPCFSEIASPRYLTLNSRSGVALEKLITTSVNLSRAVLHGKSFGFARFLPEGLDFSSFSLAQTLP